MEKHEIVHMLLDLHEWRMEHPHRAMFFQHDTGENQKSSLRVQANTGNDEDDIRSEITIEYEDESVDAVVERIEDWKDKIEKYERIARGAV